MTRLGAMVPGADRDPLPVQHRADVVRVDAIQHEGQHAGLLLRGADDPESGNLGHRFGRVGQQIPLVGLDGFQADAAHVIEGRSEGDAPAMFGVPASNL